MKLLLVDDVEANLVALEAILARPGVSLLRARSGEEALERLLVEDVALALIDVHMPEMDGFELAELMRGSPRTQHIPILFVTAGTRDPLRVFRGYEAGAVDFLFKPLDAHVLRSKVEVFIQLQQRTQELAEHVEQLEQALRLNETFLAVLAHDLRNPLGAVLTGAELIRASSQDPPSTRNAARIAESARRMARLIDQLLDMARARSGGSIPVLPVPADLRDLCARAVQEVEAASGRGVSHVAVEGDTCGHWDADRVMQILANLLSNAARHGDPAEPIRVVADGTRQDEVRLSVHNGGVIPPEILPHVFEPFRTRTSERQRRSGGGLGLGLYIARLMTEAHGGAILVRSSAAHGTTFEVRLPRVSAAVPPNSGEIVVGDGASAPPIDGVIR
jgi:signal transduction histidine kinase